MDRLPIRAATSVPGPAPASGQLPGSKPRRVPPPPGGGHEPALGPGAAAPGRAKTGRIATPRSKGHKRPGTANSEDEPSAARNRKEPNAIRRPSGRANTVIELAIVKPGADSPRARVPIAIRNHRGQRNLMARTFISLSPEMFGGSTEERESALPYTKEENREQARPEEAADITPSKA